MGENFFNKYISGYAKDSIEDGYIAAGYEIWREFVAEYMATLLDKDMQTFSIEEYAGHIEEMVKDIEGFASDSKLCMSAIALDIFICEMNYHK